MFEYKFHFSWVFLLLSPLAGLLANFYSLLRNRKLSYFSLSAALCLLYTYLPILWDVRSNFVRIFYFPEDGLNIYTGILSILSKNFEFSYIGAVFAFAILTSFILSIILSSDLDEIQYTKSKAYFFFAVALFLSLFEYRQLFDLQKTTLAVTFFLAGLSVKNSLHKHTLYLLSVIIHPLTSPIVLFQILTMAISPNRKSLLLFTLLSIIIGLFIYEPLINLVASYQNLVPANVMLYLLIEDSRFSTPEIALLIRLLRLASIFIIFFVFLRYVKNNAEDSLKNHSRLILILCSFSLLISFNEIALERYYYATYATTIYVILKHKIDWSRMRFAAMSIFANILLHGLFTLSVIFSEGYEVYASNQIKYDTALKVTYYPTPLLIIFSDFGASNEYFKKFTQY